MEKLEITNFLSIEKAEIEIKKINIFIGPQAQGKSVIAKLIYFFKEYPQMLVESIRRNLNTKEGCDHLVLVKFENIFPKYTWGNHEFTICYSNNYYSVSIANKSKVGSETQQFKLDLDSDFIIREVLTGLSEVKNHDPYLTEKYDNKLENPHFYSTGDKRIFYLLSENFSFLNGYLIEHLFRDNEKPFLEKNFYIPAGRSFFASLDKNIYSFVSSEIKIDYFLTLFGKIYQQTREKIKAGNSSWCEPEKRKRLDGLVKQLIGGDFLFEEGQDWIINNKDRINLADASSGQQEVLPMAVVLSNHPYFHHSHIRHHFVIEEPEAHLFPVAQNQIVLLIANAYNEIIDFNKFNSFTITTHSPYILTAFNNLIQAGNVAASKNNQNLEELYNIVPESEIVDFNDVAAYRVNQGTVSSILNTDMKLIDANIIDDISNHFADTFEKLLAMEEL